MGIRKDYAKETVNTIMQINPDLDKDRVEEIVIRKMKERISDPSITMDNNVSGENEKIKLTDLCNWIDKRNPVVSGNATFYMQPEVLQSPTSNMLRALKKARKDIKKEMFKYNQEDDEYQRLDLSQLNAKVIMNAEYGASGAPTAAFYNKYSPAATTLMAQSIITTMAAFFEGYVGDNQKFFSVNECMDWMNTVSRKKNKIHKWIVCPTVEETIHRVKSHFIMYDQSDNYVIDNYLKNSKDEELVNIFYANNIKDFIRRHEKVRSLIKQILVSLPLYEASENEIPGPFRGKFGSIEKYNEWVSKEMFLNPYDIPECIKDCMKELTEIMNQYCFVEYLTPDSIVKLNNHKRNTVILVDTDSNIINTNIFVKFILEEIFPENTFSRNKIYNEMICVNVLASILDNCVVRILDMYGKCHNMGEDARKELTMKNEYMFRRIVLFNKKKRYASSIVLREGNISIPFKTEIKGLDFIKAGVTEEVTQKFTEMLENYILFSEDLELHQLMRELKRFEDEIYNDLRKGGVRFLKPQVFKTEGAYKKTYDKVSGEEVTRAWSLPVFRAVAVWNEIYPQQKIYSLDRVKLIKLSVTGPTDIECIKGKHPSEYNLVMDKVFKSLDRNIQNAGLKVIAIPSTVLKIPEWIIDLIDYDVIISDVVGSFRSILEAFRVDILVMNTKNNKANIVSSLISI